MPLPKSKLPTVESDLPYTGERMVPYAAHPVTFWEHIERYRFACSHARGMTVLDIACGEGYGSAALRNAGAVSVIGVDISSEAVDHARHHHGVDARVGSAMAIPLSDQSVDLIVSFETIEHVSDPPLFVDECWRVLRPGGRLIMSTPNPEIYQSVIEHNPFHVAEMPIEQFRIVIDKRFEVKKLLGQSVPAAWYMRTRGIGRLTKWLQTVFCGRRTDVVDPDDRERAVELASRPPGWLDKRLFTDAVQPIPIAGLSRCCYIVAFATRRN